MPVESVLGLPPEWEQLIGRLHPSLVHFPVALVLFALLCEVLGLRRNGSKPSPAALPAVVCGALGAWAAGTAGWVLHETEGPSTGLVEWHEYTGIALIGLTSLSAFLALRGRSGERTGATEGYRFTLCFASVLVLVVGHLGGSLTHGSSYLTKPLTAVLGWDWEDEPSATSQPAADDAPAVTAEDASDAVDAAAGDALARVDFASRIRPLFEARCVECHNADKTKGKLRLDIPPTGGDAIVAGDPDASEVVARISLPADDFDIMPPKGDPLTAEQVALVRQWIAEGADWPEG